MWRGTSLTSLLVSVLSCWKTDDWKQAVGCWTCPSRPARQMQFLPHDVHLSSHPCLDTIVNQALRNRVSHSRPSPTKRWSLNLHQWPQKISNILALSIWLSLGLRLAFCCTCLSFCFALRCESRPGLPWGLSRRVLRRSLLGLQGFSNHRPPQAWREVSG